MEEKKEYLNEWTNDIFNTEKTKKNIKLLNKKIKKEKLESIKEETSKIFLFYN